MKYLFLFYFIIIVIDWVDGRAFLDEEGLYCWSDMVQSFLYWWNDFWIFCFEAITP